MKLPGITTSAEVIDTIQKLRREVRELADGWRLQQSLSNDKIERKIDFMIEQLAKLNAWTERMGRQ
jgi:hypothetical protein